MFKHILMTCLLFFCLTAMPASVQAAEIPAPVQEIIELSPIAPDEMQNMALPDIMAGMWNIFCSNYAVPLAFAQKMFLYVLLAGAAQLLFSAEYKEYIDFPLLAGYVLLVAAMLAHITNSMTVQLEAWNRFLGLLLPGWAGLLAAGGMPALASVTSQSFMAVASVFSFFLKEWIFPLIKVYWALIISGRLWHYETVSQASKAFLELLRLLFRLLAIFLGAVLSAQSFLAANGDTLTLRTGQFLLANSIPIVGQAAANALGSVLAGLRLVKGYLAFSAMAVITVQFLPLIFQIVLDILAFRFCAIFAQALGFDRGAGIAIDLTEGLKFCLSIIAVYFLLMFFSTALLVLLGG